MDLSQYLNPQTIALVQTGWYLFMFWLAIVEWPVVIIAWAFLASFGILDIWIVLLLWWIGQIVGDTLYYSIGHFGLSIFHKKTVVDSKKKSSFLLKLDHLIQTNLILALLIVKFTPYAPPIGLTYIGKTNVDMRKYILYSAILCVPIPVISVLVGYHIGYISSFIQNFSLTEWSPQTERIEYILWAFWMIIIAIGAYFFLKKKSAKVLKQEAIILKKIEKRPEVGEGVDESVQQR